MSMMLCAACDWSLGRVKQVSSICFIADAHYLFDEIIKTNHKIYLFIAKYNHGTCQDSPVLNGQSFLMTLIMFGSIINHIRRTVSAAND